MERRQRAGAKRSGWRRRPAGGGGRGGVPAAAETERGGTQQLHERLKPELEASSPQAALLSFEEAIALMLAGKGSTARAAMAAESLKSLDVMREIATNKLVYILNFTKLQIEKMLSRSNKVTSTEIVAAADACLLALYIMTSRRMPKRVYLEDVIDCIVQFVNSKLQKTDGHSDAGGAKDDNNNISRAKKRRSQPCESINVLYEKTLDILNLFVELLDIQILPEPLISNLLPPSVSSFFAQSEARLQQVSLKLLKIIFVRYKEQRWCMMSNIVKTLSIKSDGSTQITNPATGFLQLFQGFVEIGADFDKSERSSWFTENYERVMMLGGMFLTFLRHECGSRAKSSENFDIRNLIKSFVVELLAVLSKPEYPATQLMLMMSGRLCVNTFSNKQVDGDLRIFFLECLCLIMEHMQRSRSSAEREKDVIRKVVESCRRGGGCASAFHEPGGLACLRDVLLNFLTHSVARGEMPVSARNFYILEQYMEQTAPDCAKNQKNRRKKSKKLIMEEIRVEHLVNRLQQGLVSSGDVDISYGSAAHIKVYLMAKIHFQKWFQLYLLKVLILAKDSSLNIRIKAVRCIGTLVEQDFSLLTLSQVSISLKYMLLDEAPMVREAIVDLLKLAIVKQPELLDDYYEQLSNRILDTSAGVRKAVIRVMRNICIEHPEHPLVPQMCVRLVRRLNDEESTQKLVTETFMAMWFTPGNEDGNQKARNIVSVVTTCYNTEMKWFEQLIRNIFHMAHDKKTSSSLNQVCREIIDALIVIADESNKTQFLQRSAMCFVAIRVLASVRPQFIIRHVDLLQSYLDMHQQTNQYALTISNIVEIFKLIIPNLKTYHKVFLSKLERTLMQLVFNSDRHLVAACIACLASILNEATHYYAIIRDCLKKYHDFLKKIKLFISSSHKNAKTLKDVHYERYFRRAVFVIGLLFRYFDFTVKEVYGDLGENIKEEVFQLLLFFLKEQHDNIKVNVLQAIGSICLGNSMFMMNDDLKNCYHETLMVQSSSVDLKLRVLLNIEAYLLLEIDQASPDVFKGSKDLLALDRSDDDLPLQIMNTVVQHYLNEILQLYLHFDMQIRKTVARIVQLVLEQGQVSSVQIIPYLISMSADDEEVISLTAKKHLLRLHGLFPNFIGSRALAGMKLTFQLQKLLPSVEVVRGFRIRHQKGHPAALNDVVYSILRRHTQQRRALVKGILRHFNEKSNLDYLVFLADNLAHFSYATQDELLFLLYSIDVIVSESGDNLLQVFKKELHTGENEDLDLTDEEDDFAEIMSRLSKDTKRLRLCFTSLHCCSLLLTLREYLMKAYHITDHMVQQYSLVKTLKQHDKPVKICTSAPFDPVATIDVLKERISFNQPEDNKKLVKEYLHFKKLMLHDEPRRAHVSSHNNEQKSKVGKRKRNQKAQDSSGSDDSN